MERVREKYHTIDNLNNVDILRNWNYNVATLFKSRTNKRERVTIAHADALTQTKYRIFQRLFYDYFK